MRCPRCGNENNPTNRFCGMCGATLQPVSAGASESPAQRPGKPSTKPSVPPAAPQLPSTPPAPPVVNRTTAPAPEETPAISGPSFLGLNNPASSVRASESRPSEDRSSARLTLDPSSSSRSLDYLLNDDEDEPQRSGAGKWILILVALALAVGFGYLHWKNQGFSWLTSGSQKPAAATTDTSDSNLPSNPSSAAQPTTTPPSTTPPASATPASGPAANSGPTPSAPSPTPSSPGPTAANSTPPAANAPASTQAGGANSAATNTPASTTATAPSAGNASAPDTTSNSAATPAAKDSSDADDASSDAANSKPVAAAKPSPAARPVQPADPVVEAQKYIYGKGARQDCDRGLRLLKPAADQSNPKAMVEMGALYSAGLCTPRDLPTAYRWFALALRKDPNNQSVQDDLQKLWGEMTQPERQLAIRLSQ